MSRSFKKSFGFFLTYIKDCIKTGFPFEPSPAHLFSLPMAIQLQSAKNTFLSSKLGRAFKTKESAVYHFLSS